MVARLTMYDDVDVELSDRLAEWMKGQEQDPFAELPGYHGSMTLVDRENARLIGIGFYASETDAQEAERRLPEIFEHAASKLPADLQAVVAMQPASTALLDVVHDDRR
jgi:hypothetical protein